MFKLLSFFAILAVAFAAPAPEPGAILAPVAYKAPAYAYLPQPLGYPAVPAAQYAYGSPFAYSAYPAYPAYNKLY